MRAFDDEIVLDKKFKHDVSVVVDRLVVKDGLRRRLTDSIETAARLSDGLIEVVLADGPTLTFSEKFACLACGISMPEIQPRIFSFNNPHGACPACHGLGSTQEIDPELVVPDHSLSISQGAMLPSAGGRLDGRHLPGRDRALSREPRHALAGPAARAARPVPQGHARPHRHALPQLRGPLAALQGAVPRHPRQPQAPLRRDRIRPHPPEDRGVHERASVRGVPRVRASSRRASRSRSASATSTSSRS